MEKAELIELIQKSKDGDMDAMEKLLLHAHTSVSYQCRKMLKNEQDAEDMTQEILVTVYQKLDTLKEPAAFNQWLKKITAARCINVMTRTHTELQFAEDEEGHSILNTLEEMDEKKIPDKWLDNKETSRMIEDIIDGLPDVQRLCTLMFYYSEISVKEMARIMKVSENTIKSRLGYARKAIKEKVLDYEKKGVKLYGISPLPFLFYFLHRHEKEERNPVAAQIMVDEILAQSAFAAAGIVNAAGSAASGTTGSVAAAAGTAGTGAAGAATTGFLSILGTIPMKIAAGVTAALVFVGGVTAAATVGADSRQEATVATIVLEEQGSDSGNENILIQETMDVTEITEVTEETEFSTETTEPEVEETISTGAESYESSGKKEDTAVGSDGNTSSGSDGTQNPENSTDTTPTDGSAEEDTENSTTEIDLTAHSHQYVVAYTQTSCCKEQGYTEYKCTSCGESYIGDYTDTLPHNYTKTVVPPTAYSQGYTKYECTNICVNHYHLNSDGFCDDMYTTDYTEKLASDTDTSGCTHSFIETTIRGATCNGEGIQKYTCVDCDFSYTETVPKYTEHEWVLNEGIATTPGCDWDGNEGYWCKHCRLWKPDDIIPALGHEYSATVVEPTETTQGYTEFTCSRCGNSFKDNYTEFSGGTTSVHTHSYTSVVTEPTCSEQGYTTYTCACGHSYQGDAVEATGDIMEVTVVAPTESTPGYTEHRCVICGMSYRTDYTDFSEDGTTVVHEHSYTISVETIPATCTEYGRIDYTCACGSMGSSEPVSPTGHSYDVSDTSTCTEAGIRTYTCTKCGGSYIEEVSAGCKSYTVNVVTPTETEQGYTEYTCPDCGASYRDSYTDPITTVNLSEEPHIHNYTSVVTVATCTVGGYTTCTCNCGDFYIEDATDATGHSYTSSVVNPTETDQGYTEYTCTVCGDHYTDSYVDVLENE